MGSVRSRHLYLKQDVQLAPLAQSEEFLHGKERVRGSIPRRGSEPAGRPRRSRRGKSGLRRAGWPLTAARGDPRESATENRPPGSGWVRVKRRCKRPPAVRVTGLARQAPPGARPVSQGAARPMLAGRPLRWMAVPGSGQDRTRLTGRLINMRAWLSGRALRCQHRGRGFDPRRPLEEGSQVPMERRWPASTQAQYLRRHSGDPLATGSTRENLAHPRGWLELVDAYGSDPYASKGAWEFDSPLAHSVAVHHAVSGTGPGQGR